MDAWMGNFLRNDYLLMQYGMTTDRWLASDKDRQNIKQQRIAPLQEKYLCPKNKYPPNRIDTLPWLEEISMCDLQFFKDGCTIHRALNADSYDERRSAFRALGQEQIKPGDRHLGIDAEAKILVANIYISTTERYLVPLIQDLHPVHHASHKIINFELGKEYHLLTKQCAEYDKNKNEALCYFHFFIASELGDASSSFELAKICREENFSFPEEWDSKNLLARRFEQKAHEQAEASQEPGTTAAFLEWSSKFT